MPPAFQQEQVMQPSKHKGKYARSKHMYNNKGKVTYDDVAFDSPLKDPIQKFHFQLIQTLYRSLA